MKMKFLAIFLVLLCCLMGAASAAEDISTDAVDDAIDDVVFIDEAVDADLQADDTVSAEPVDADSDVDQSDATIEADDEEGNTRASGTATASDWTTLRNKAQEPGTDYTITLTNNITIGSDDIIFGNNAIIDGNGKIITGNIGDTRIPFKSNNASLSITFKNIKFQNINCQMLIQLETSGISKLENCTFINIDTGDDHDSVVYNNLGTMNMTKCTFVNCTTGYGAVTNYRSGTTTGVTLNVKNCTFENNTAIYEPGAINNCGQLYVWDSIFNYNNAGWWAGAIHTHTNAKTVIRNCSFNGNTAGWNGGGLYTYSDLEVYDSNFTNNNCSTDSGGGAIGASNYFFASKAYNVTVNNCRFVDNNNNATNGKGGAIAAMNGGTLSVNGSTFIHNSADIGQAIAGYNTKQYANISEGEAHLVITNNQFINHTIKTGTTVYLSGLYTFENNVFTNSPQIAYNDENDYDIIINQKSFVAPVVQWIENKKNDVLGMFFEEDLEDSEVVVDPDNQDAFSLSDALNQLASTGGTILIKKGTITKSYSASVTGSNITIIGEDRENTFMDPIRNNKHNPYAIRSGDKYNKNGTITWVNMTFICNGTELSNTNYKFINCTFINVPIQFDKARETSEYIENKEEVDIFNYEFENCDFINYGQNNVIIGYMFSNVSILSCTFDNVTVDAIVSTNANHTDSSGRQAGLTIKDSTFKDVTINGVAKVQTELISNVNVEDCDYIGFDATTDGVVDGDYTYLNATKLKVVAVDSVVDISSPEKGTVVVTLTDNSTNPIAGATFKYTVNGGEEKIATTGDDGKYAITGLTGEVTVAVNYEGNESYNAISDSKFFNFTDEPAPSNDTNGSNSTPVTPTKVATKLTASKVTATYNVAKKLVITLKDASGKALANKKVTVKVGSISKTLKTNAKGQVSFNVATLVPKTYTATVKFAGDSSYKASSVKPKVVVNKAKPKLAAKAKTFKAKVKTKKFTATLKNNKGKVLKNTKLTLKVGKKTFTAKTNKKGVATFKITKLSKAKKYTATIKFAGNKYFKALSKKVKITVKK